VIIEPAAADPPVVSRSTTQKVMSRNGLPSSSKLRWLSHRDSADPWGADPWGVVLVGLMVTSRP
jgi:hypothetical protein